MAVFKKKLDSDVEADVLVKGCALPFNSQDMLRTYCWGPGTVSSSLKHAVYYEMVSLLLNVRTIAD